MNNEEKLLALEDRLLGLEFRQLKKKLGEDRMPVTTSICCTGDCKPCGAWKGNRQMVMSMTGRGKYGQEPHFPCSPNCKSAELLKIEERKRQQREVDRNRQIRTRGYCV